MLARPLVLAAALLALAGARASEEESLKIPVQVDQSGKHIFFVVDSGSDVPAEAAKFCVAHLPSTDGDECAAQLTARVAETRDAQFEAQHALPGISFSVRNHDGDTLRFVHEEGASPVAESREFCREHFEQVPEADCIEAMLQNAQRALEEATMVTGSRV